MDWPLALVQDKDDAADDEAAAAAEALGACELSAADPCGSERGARLVRGVFLHKGYMETIFVFDKSLTFSAGIVWLASIFRLLHHGRTLPQGGVRVEVRDLIILGFPSLKRVQLSATSSGASSIRPLAARPLRSRSSQPRRRRKTPLRSADPIRWDGICDAAWCGAVLCGAMLYGAARLRTCFSMKCPSPNSTLSAQQHRGAEAASQKQATRRSNALNRMRSGGTTCLTLLV